MNRVILQIWESSDREKGTRSDGCSVHIDFADRESYINSIYKYRTPAYIPEEYDRIVGDPIEAFISDVLFSKVKLKKSIRIYEHEMNNLLSMQEIIVRND